MVNAGDGRWRRLRGWILICGMMTAAACTGVDASGAITTASTSTTASTVLPSSPAPTTADSVSTTRADGIGELDGRWSTSGAAIVDGDGDPVHIRGVNWFGFETADAAPHGLWARNLESMLDQIADMGFNTIRLPFSAAMLDPGVVPSSIDYAANPDLRELSSLELMDRFVEAAGARGLAIVLDRHALAADNRTPLWYDSAFPNARLITDWERLAERYAGRPNVVGADIHNEPHDDACWGCADPDRDWPAAATEAANAIHAIAPHWLVFVEGVEQVDGASCDAGAPACTWWGGNLIGVADSPVTPNQSNRVVYSPHEYATSVSRQPWFDDPSFPENMPAIWDRFWGYIQRDDLAPIMVGEFGTTLEAAEDGVWLETLVEYLDQIGAGFTFWSLNPNSGDTGGILEDDWTTIDEDKLAYLAPLLPGPFAPVD